jgi:hypothetical protein
MTPEKRNHCQNPATPPARVPSTEGQSRMSGDSRCRYCRGRGEVNGVIDDIEFTFQCPCAGGCDEAVRWLLGLVVEQQPQGLPKTA